MMKLVPNWKRAWRMLSVQLAAVAVIFGLLPADQQAALLQLLGLQPQHVPAIIGALFIAARLVNQPKVQP